MRTRRATRKQLFNAGAANSKSKRKTPNLIFRDPTGKVVQRLCVDEDALMHIEEITRATGETNSELFERLIRRKLRLKGW